MRTTVTLEDDVAAAVKELAHQQRLSFKAVLNELLRRGLSAQTRAESSGARFEVEPHRSAFKPGIDPTKLNQLVDRLEADAFMNEARGLP